MTAAQFDFLLIIKADVMAMGLTPLRMGDVLKVMPLVPETLAPAEAAAAFIRWLLHDPGQERDAPLREILSRVALMGDE
jgi:hypothetical protein